MTQEGVYMVRRIAAIGAALAIVFVSVPLSSHAALALGEIGDTQITLSCNDGHSVTAALDQNALLALTAEIQALNDPSGLSCTLTPADPPAASWTVYDYNPSGQALAPRKSPNSMPATTGVDGSISFPFKADIYTALLTTTDKSLTGDLHTKTLNATVEVQGGTVGTFQDQHNGGCADRKYVRFFLVSPKASGTTGPGTTGFYTQFWWSNPVDVTLATDPQLPLSMTAVVDGVHQWSDWNGTFNDASPEVMEHFQTAIHNVQTVGFSFGGGCFFENGVTTSDGEGVFNTTFSEGP
jgi:hypothetical protein